jgi:hypothetical protein
MFTQGVAVECTEEQFNEYLQEAQPVAGQFNEYLQVLVALYIYFYVMSLLVCPLAELSSRFEGEVVDTSRGATILKVVVVAPSRNPSNKLDRTRSSRPNRLGKNASIVARLPCLWQKMKLPRVH